MDIFNPNIDKFIVNYNLGKPQLLYAMLSADLHTPVSTMIRLKKEKYIFLYESVENGNNRGRYSAIGINPDLIWECKNNKCFTKNFNKKKKIKKHRSPPILSLKKLFKNNKFKIPKNLPPMSSGLFGYLGYEMISNIENLKLKNKDDLNLPDSIFIRPTVMLIFDNVCDTLFIIKTIWPSDEKADFFYKKSELEILKLLKVLKKPIKLSNNVNQKDANELNSVKKLKEKVFSNTSFSEFKSMVSKAKKYIYSGEIFQVVISRYFKKKITTTPLAIYRALRFLNPSPYLFYIKFNDFYIIGSSPEILVKLDEKKVTIRPIAGTKKRGKNNLEDEKLKNELLEDPKEISEHLMLLDLGRNDTSKVCKSGSVKVTKKMYVEYFSHVMHIVSNINGIIKDEADNVDALFSGFPAGTVSGAPKIRAMEIINELEPESRGIYAGCVGYFSANGSMETCIVLRTAIVKDKKMYVQAGAGIVADSDPKKEYVETINKAKALFKAAENSYKAR